MAGGGVLVAAAAAVVLATVVVVSASIVGGRIQGVLTLERAFPVGEKVELEVIKARDRARHARILQSFAGGIVDFPVGGTSDPYSVGLYYTKVRLGSPPQEFNVQIDTGSDILWVACSSCNDCPQNSGLGMPLNFFNVAASSTVSPISCSDNMCSSIVQVSSAECSTESNHCGYSFQYGDGSGTSGFYASDMLYFDTIAGTSLISNSSASVVFGCSTSLFGDLTKSDRAVDGIFGFGQQGLSVISQLSSHGITPKIFSHCLKGESGGGGVLVLGNRGTIVDSGTTLAYLVEEAYDPFVAAITASVSSSAKPIMHKESQCYLLSKSIGDVFPSVAFNFAGSASMVLKPADYLVHMGYLDGDSMWCMGFIRVENEGATILGDLVLKDKIFVYDLDHQRLGWEDYDCSMPVNVSITSGKDEYVNAGQLSVSSSSSFTNLSNAMPLLLGGSQSHMADQNLTQ
ncbi:aspartic proteinase 36-like isoform X3 [Andrographis paniculata]|uniref:aspartic proteinase 36-like isoform X3 n=1 Tax=Andrographis paniculata TaxID=175694 RepID=UPI0021E9437F|nr:aspartic proteinase 36-like isoform X3 [Andrographis paniculata]